MVDPVLAVCPDAICPLSFPTGLYIHIPFCDKRCDYCDFATFSDKSSRVDEYLGALQNEMFHAGSPAIETLFIGGGTPSVLSPFQIESLMKNIHTHFNASALGEATVEMNPESASAEKILEFIKGGINRVSFGLQSTQEKFLKILGRLHSYNTFIKAFQMAEKLNLKNINIDLMFGLPQQTLDDWKESLKQVAELKPAHISTYALKIEPGTPFWNKKITVDDDLEADMYLWASEFLRDLGYHHYEISNFALPGHECRHNLNYWKNGVYFGVGLSAASHNTGHRWQNTRNFDLYLNHWGKPQPSQISKKSLEEKDFKKENIMLGLRLSDGVQTHELEELNIPEVGKFLDQGLAFIEGGRYRLNSQGWLLSNQLFQKLV